MIYDGLIFYHNILIGGDNDKRKAKELDSKTLILQHYKEDADGLCTALGDPLAREGGAAYSVDKTAFIESGWTIKREEITVSGQWQCWRCLY